MPKRTSKKQLADINVLASSIVHAVTEEKPSVNVSLHEAAVALGRLGGLKGGPARAATLSASKRKQIAKKAAEVRWKKGKRSTSL